MHYCQEAFKMLEGRSLSTFERNFFKKIQKKTRQIEAEISPKLPVKVKNSRKNVKCQCPFRNYFHSLW